MGKTTRVASAKRSRGLRALALTGFFALTASMLVAIAPSSAAHADAGSSCGPTINPIVCENSKPGTDPSVWDINGAGDSDIQGFATDISVDVGSTIGFKIDTTASAYKIDIYRTGYYQGLGARYIASVTPSAKLPQTQPQCITDTTTELYDCGNWALSASWNVPSDAVSGVYVAKLTRTDNGDSSHIIFIVRNDASHSDVVFQTSDPTWEAYNTYGGADFYMGGANGRAYKISYNRPFATRGANAGRDFYFSGEFATVQFLEQNGYDVTYMAGVDTDRYGSLLRNHKVFLSVGHDEYWSAAQRSNVLAARDAGVNLQFLSGNEMYWHTRYEPSIDGTSTPYRTLVSYKETWGNAANPGGGKIDTSTPEWTGTWRDPRFATAANGGSLPENGVTGTMYMSNSDDLPVTVTAAQGKTRLWRNTGLTSLAAGSTQALAPHTVGYESDEDVDNGFRPAGLIDLSTTIGATPQYLTDYGNVVVPGTTVHHVTLYKAASGALVFSAGSIQWGWGLNQNHDGAGAPADARMQQAQVNLLADMGAQPGTLMAGLAPAAKSTDTTPPTAVVTSPAAGASIANGATVTATGTASDVGGVVAGVEVSTDGGSTWHPATGTTSWSYTYVQQGAGATTVIARAIDDSANFSPSGTSVGITVTGPYSAFGTVVPATPSTGDTSAVELGLQFTPATDGFVTGVRFYKGTANTGTHVGSLWDTATGQNLARVTFTNETGSGWQTATFSASVPVVGGHKYTVSYSAPNGGYAAMNLYWPYHAQTSTPVTVASGVGANAPGVYGTIGVMPAATYQEANYYVDALFTQSDSSPLHLSGQTPLAGSTSNPPTGAVSAVISRTVVASTVAMTVKDASGTAAAGSVAYDATSRTVTFTPASALNASTAYTATVTATDSSGIGFSGGNTWTFTTAAATLPPGTCPCQLFPDATVPAITSAADSAAVTLGVRFTTSASGTITALRFYKGAANTGTHTGTLWSATGTALATVTYANESTQGWQTAALSQPVAVTAGTQYVASYTAPVGAYAATAGQFSAAYGYGPLQVPAAGSVYSYSGGFPTSTSTTGYGVDVVFQPPANGPALTGGTPQAGANGVAGTAPITGTFDSAVASAQVAVSSGGTAIAGATTWSSDQKTFTFTPAAALPTGAIVVVAVSSVQGTSGAAGMNASWSFATASTAAAPVVTFFDGGSAAAAATATGDTSSVVLGMSFTTSAPGQVRAIRFYKAAGNTGTHTGWLWGSDPSTPLATVTFTNESASGWQSATLSTPVALVSGVTYTVSYVAPKGNYTYQSGAFTTPVTSAPLTAVEPGNGVYLYGASGKPTSSYNATNYFVDVEFVADTNPAQTLWGSSTVPAVPSASDTAPVEVGTAFTVDKPGQVTAIRFYKGAANTGTHVGSLWTSTGTKLASVTFAGETATGWQRAALSTPVAITAGTTYIVSYFAPNGGYAQQTSYFTSPVVSGDITGIAGDNGLYLYSATGGFPTQSYLSSAYFVDAEVTFGSTQPSPAPSVTSTTPTASATNVDPATATISATLANATSATIALAAGDTAVAGTSSFNATSGVVSFTPSAALAYGTTYSVTVTANGASVTGGTWTFSTRPAATLSATTPAANATIVDPTTVAITATLVNATSGTIALKAGTTAVAGTSSFTASTGVVTFVPASQLAWSTGYTATVTANSGAVAGGTWSFTTSGQPISLFPTGTPTTPNAKASLAIQVATRFTANAPGVVTAVKFYKGTSNTGTHTGYLWSATGTRLATVTFTNETASGWQTATLSAPVRLTVGAEYRVGVYGTSTYYALTTGGLTTVVTNGALSTIATGGAYVYGTTYPNTTSTNKYWVDVLFRPDS